MRAISANPYDACHAYGKWARPTREMTVLSCSGTCGWDMGFVSPSGPSCKKNHSTRDIATTRQTPGQTTSWEEDCDRLKPWRILEIGWNIKMIATNQSINQPTNQPTNQEFLQAIEKGGNLWVCIVWLVPVLCICMGVVLCKWFECLEWVTTRISSHFYCEYMHL